MSSERAADEAFEKFEATRSGALPYREVFHLAFEAGRADEAEELVELLADRVRVWATARNAGENDRARARRDEALAITQLIQARHSSGSQPTSADDLEAALAESKRVAATIAARERHQPPPEPPLTEARASLPGPVDLGDAMREIALAVVNEVGAGLKVGEEMIRMDKRLSALEAINERETALREKMISAFGEIRLEKDNALSTPAPAPRFTETVNEGSLVSPSQIKTGKEGAAPPPAQAEPAKGVEGQAARSRNTPAGARPNHGVADCRGRAART